MEGNPNLDRIISYPDPWIQSKQPLGYLRLVTKLRWQGFDTSYVFHSHTLIHLMARLAGIPRRYGFFDPDLKKDGNLLFNKALWQPNSDRYIADNYLDVPRLAGWQGDDLTLDFYLSDAEQQHANQVLLQNHLKPGKFLVAAPGGGVNPRQNVFEKRWGARKYADLCDLLRREWGLPIVLIGSQHEMEMGCQINAVASKGVIDLIGRLPFRLSAALIRRSRMLICNDSAVMHVAVAFGIPSLAIFGPSNPKSLLPVSQLNQWITSGIDCSPCYCNSIFPGCEHLRCMEELTVRRVLERIKLMRDQLKDSFEESPKNKVASD